MTINRADVAARLVEERERLGHTRSNFARETDMSREALRNYETAQQSMGSDFLLKAAALGVDVQYVLFGVRFSGGEPPKPPGTPQVNVQGTANIVQEARSGATINMIAPQKYITKNTAIVNQGKEHITEDQAAKLTSLVKEIVETEYRLKKKPKSYRAVWGALNAHCHVTQYKLIPLESYSKAESFLRRWIGRLNAMASAPLADNVAWRNKRYAFIKINTREDNAWLAAYLKRIAKDATSIKDLSDANLDKLYRAVASRKQLKK